MICCLSVLYTLFTCLSSLVLSHRNGKYETVFEEKINFPEKRRNKWLTKHR